MFTARFIKQSSRQFKSGTSITHSSPNSLYSPFFASKFLRDLATMSGTEGKQGVHNLESLTRTLPKRRKKAFDEAMDIKDTLMVLDCFATWCGPCKVIAPQIVKFSDEYPKARFYKLDVDQVSDVAQELGVRAMPTFMLFKNGEKVTDVVGANPKALEAAIQNNI
ncbi:MAG: Cytoplasmic thioredoxin isoenzyme 2 [Chrysothrix sp. TS-e1954]|nr:MAG: Cytoplasmic thioredoxin isoenzyme 2 [Chrysothrix sp. TS-e1954]